MTLEEKIKVYEAVLNHYVKLSLKPHFVNDFPKHPGICKLIEDYSSHKSIKQDDETVRQFMIGKENYLRENFSEFFENAPDENAYGDPLGPGSYCFYFWWSWPDLKVRIEYIENILIKLKKQNS